MVFFTYFSYAMRQPTMIGLNRQQATTAPFMLLGMSLIFWICT